MYFLLSFSFFSNISTSSSQRLTGCCWSGAALICRPLSSYYAYINVVVLVELTYSNFLVYYGVLIIVSLLNHLYDASPTTNSSLEEELQFHHHPCKTRSLRHCLSIERVRWKQQPTTQEKQGPTELDG